MSNHHHLVVTDVEGRLPEFTREFHRSVAKALNALQGQWESLWSSEPVSVVRLTAVEDVLRKIVYVATNPVTAGLVKCPSEWPGVNHWSTFSKEVRRPAAYFDSSGHMPETVLLKIVPPNAVRLSSWSGRVRVAVSLRVNALTRQAKPFLGPRVIMAQSFLARARSPETRRTLNPLIAAVNRTRRAAALQAEKAFRIAYRVALEAWKNGNRMAVFPVGTWWMRVHHRVPLTNDDSGCSAFIPGMPTQ